MGILLAKDWFFPIFNKKIKILYTFLVLQLLPLKSVFSVSFNDFQSSKLLLSISLDFSVVPTEVEFTVTSSKTRNITLQIEQQFHEDDRYCEKSR